MRETYNLWENLKRRNVIKATVAYLITAWLLIQIADIILHSFDTPDWVMRALIVILILGLPMTVILAWFFEYTRDGLKSADKVDTQEAIRAGERIKNLILVVLSISFVYLIYDKFFVEYEEKEVHSSKITSAAEEKTIAVLPFKNLSDNKNNIYFSDGIMEAILNNLSRIEDLKVVSRTSVERYRGTEKSIPHIGDELDVAHILEGSVQRIGDKVRISTQLISTEEDKHLWSHNYDREISDIFEIQSEIATSVAENLELIITSKTRQFMTNAPTSHLKAYDLYLQAANLEDASSEENLKAIEMCQTAIDMDPNFALAYVGLANGIFDLSWKRYTPVSVWKDSVLNLVDKAIRLKPNLWEAYAVRTEVYFILNEFDKAYYNVDKVLVLKPNNSRYIGLAGEGKIRQGNYQDGLELIMESISLIPPIAVKETANRIANKLINIDRKLIYKFVRKVYENSSPSTTRGLHSHLLNAQLYDRDYDSYLETSLAASKRFKEPNFVQNLGEAYLYKKEFENARETYELLAKMNESANNSFLKNSYKHKYAYSLIMTGDSARGFSMINKYRELLLDHANRNTFLTYRASKYYDLAVIEAILNKPDEAIDWLILAWEQEKNVNFPWTSNLMGDPMLDILRDHPRFQSLLKEVTAEEALAKRIFRGKLEAHQKRGELLWLAD
ncbi:MAG: hypothetical protein ABJF11_16490 [Reichenbachiella sp.]|uniref:tetratricopeptide repeat protein n=1 Tax=Reichenbachiella sp. TaxID=2184521 RepID=UPI0032634B35